MATSHKNRTSTALLDEAVAGWRRSRTADEGLSADARDAVIQAALEPVSPTERPIPALFLPLRRMIAAGAMPVLVLTLALGWLARPTVETTPVAHGAPSVHVTKQGDEVIFLIANGQRPHAIYKSEAPNRFDAPPAFWTDDGSFRDRLNAGPDLVFYRID